MSARNPMNPTSTSAADLDVVRSNTPLEGTFDVLRIGDNYQVHSDRPTR